MNPKLASRGGKARASKLTQAERSAIAKRGAEARWNKPPGESAKTQVLFIRAEDALVALVDAYLKAERLKRPGVRLSRSDVVRELLYERLSPPPA